MKIKKFRIKNYKSIIDSGDCYLTNDVTILAGKNESGKTSILEALEDFNINSKIRTNAKPIKNESAIPEISITFEIAKSNLETIFSSIGLNKSFSKEVSIEIKKIFPQKFSISEDTQKVLGLDRASIVSAINATIKQLLKAAKSIEKYPEIEENFSDVQELSKSISQSINQHWDHVNPTLSNLEQVYNILTAFCKKISPHLTEEKMNEEIRIELASMSSDIDKLKNLLHSYEKFTEQIKSYIPRFILFNSFEDIFPNKIPFKELENNEWIQDLSIISDLNIETIRHSDDRGKEKHKDDINVKLNTDYEKFWTQDILKLSITWDSSYLYFWIKEEGYSYEPEIRSKGHQWHLAFYIRVTARAKEKVPNIILIDEPGLFLHAQAQKDILKKLENSAKEAQLIFSTHSPYLLEPENLNRIRLIHKTTKTGTKIENNIHAVSDKETFTPIFTAIGLELSSGITNFKRKNNIVVEGMSDVYYLNAFKKIFNKESLNFIYGGGAGKMSCIGTILHGWGYKVLYLYDNDKGKKDGEKNLKKKWYIPQNLILSITDCEGDAIEDIFSKNDFKKYVLKDEKKEYDQSNSQYLKKQQKQNKVLLAKQFLESSENIESDNLDRTTSEKIEKLLKKIEIAFNNDKA